MTYSANDNQNYFVQAGRTTSRVTHRPGGNGSISLGGYTPEELEQLRKNREQAAKEETTATTTIKENTTNSMEVVEKVAEEADNKKTAAKEAETVDDVKNDDKAAADVISTQTQPQPKKGISSNAFASSSTTNSFNVLTDRPTSRVSRPPGGHTSIRLG